MKNEESINSKACEDKYVEACDPVRVDRFALPDPPDRLDATNHFAPYPDP